MQFVISDAWAQAAPDAPGSGLFSLLPLVVIFVLFYFLLIRPQQKRAKQHKEMAASLKKGDEVVTNGGTLGRVTEAGETFLTLEVADGVQIKVQRQAVQQMMPKGTMKSA
ncbi:MAG: preprotein translocase subunit YajC [Gammaproteobacteria bacterium]|nr:preprotein translocase subunit YajC [Gammaproteobacteria bacterium]